MSSNFANAVKNRHILAVSLCRVSSHRQTKLSPHRQRESIAKYCKQRGWEIIGEFSDAKSGQSAKRAGLKQAMALAMEQRAVIVCVDSWRLFRESRLTLNAYYELREAGAHVVAINDGINTFDDTPAAELFRETMACFGGFVAKQAGQKIALQNRHTVKERISEQWPHGYRTNGPQPGEWKLENGVRVPCEESRASIAACRQALSEVNKSFGKYARAAKLLNERGVPTVSSIWAKRAGRENRKSELWTVDAVRWWAKDEKERDRIRKKRNEAKRKARRSFGMEAV